MKRYLIYQRILGIMIASIFVLFLKNTLGILLSNLERSELVQLLRVARLQMGTLLHLKQKSCFELIEELILKLGKLHEGMFEMEC